MGVPLPGVHAGPTVKSSATRDFSGIPGKRSLFSRPIEAEAPGASLGAQISFLFLPTAGLWKIGGGNQRTFSRKPWDKALDFTRIKALDFLDFTRPKTCSPQELGSLRPEAFARLPGSHLLRTCQDLAVQAHLYKLHSRPLDEFSGLGLRLLGRLSEVRSGRSFCG